MEMTHIGADGEAKMVDIGKKQDTFRFARAQAVVVMKEETLAQIMRGGLKKGDVISAARLAGIMAAKKTYELIPLCHNIPIDSVELEFKTLGTDRLLITVYAACTYKTGIEMEALTAVTIASLTVYDMCKAVDRGITITDVKLLEKDGGVSGRFIARA